MPVDPVPKKGRLNAKGVLVPRLFLRHDAMARVRLQSSGRAEVPRERLSVVVTRRLPEAVETRLSELFDVRLRDDDTPMTREELVAAVQDADVLVPTVTDAIDSGLLGQAGEKLKLIANYGAGVDNIDVSTARQRGILVSEHAGCAD